MVLIGIDFGSHSCVVTSVIDGRLEALIHDLNERRIPSIVAFGERKREIGPAKFSTANILNRVYAFKHYLQPEHDTNVEPYFVRNNAVFTVNHLGKGRMFDAVQITSMLFAKIKSDANSSLHPNEVSGCVLAVPSYFKEEGRRALLLAAGIAGLDCHFLITETIAVSINYSFYKKFITPINVIFVDFGYNSIQVSAFKFSEKQIEMVAEVFESIGGRDIDKCLADHILEKINIVDINKNNKTFYAQLLHEVESFKKKLTSNTDKMPFNLKGLLYDQDNVIHIERSDMERICEPLFTKIEKLLQLCLVQSELKVDDFHSIELVGGSSRIPIVEELVYKVFRRKPIATMNRDEAVSRGCFLKSRIAKVKKDVTIIEKSTILQDKVEIDGLVTVEQVHPNFRGNGKMCLMIDDENFQHYLSIEKYLKNNDDREIERMNIRNQLEEFVNQEINFLTKFVTPEEMQELENIKYWHNGNFDEYFNVLQNWIQRVATEKERNRLDKFQDLCNFVNKHRKLLRFGVENLKELDVIESWTDGRTEEYVARQEQLMIFVEKERERRKSKKVLIDFVESELLPDGNLNHCRRKSELKELKNWNNGTTEEYVTKYKSLRECADLEIIRKNAKKKLDDLIDAETASGGMLTEYKYNNRDVRELRNWKHGTAEQYIQKYDEILKIAVSKRESLRLEHRTKLFSSIELEMEEGGILHQLNENNMEVMAWLAVKKKYDENVEYYVQKHKEFTIYVKNEKYRIANRQKLFDLIRKEEEPGGTLTQIDDQIRYSWVAITERVNDNSDYYNGKLKDLSKFIENERLRRTARQDLFDLISKEEEANGTLDEIDENIKVNWISLKYSHNATSEYYKGKLIEFLQYIKNERFRRAERQKLFDRIYKEEEPGGMLFPVDDQIRKIWMDVLLQVNENAEFYEKKYNELLRYIDYENVRRAERQYLFNLITEEKKPGGAVDAVNEDIREYWMTVLESNNQTLDFYKRKIDEFSSYITKEVLRRVEREKLFKLIQKEEKHGGYLSEVDDTVKNKWISILKRVDENGEYYNRKYNELSSCIKDHSRRELLSYIQTLESKYELCENESRYRAELDKIRRIHYDTAEEYTNQLETLKLNAKSWKLPLLRKSVRLELYEEICGLMGEIEEYDALVGVLHEIKSHLLIEVSIYNRMELDAADVAASIKNILQLVKSIPKTSTLYNTLTFKNKREIWKLESLNVTLQDKISDIKKKYQN